MARSRAVSLQLVGRAHGHQRDRHQGSEGIDSVLGEQVVDVPWAQGVLAGCNAIDKDSAHLLRVPT